MYVSPTFDTHCISTAGIQDVMQRRVTRPKQLLIELNIESLYKHARRHASNMAVHQARAHNLLEADERVNEATVAM